jgi:hypothetical protein
MLLGNVIKGIRILTTFPLAARIAAIYDLTAGPSAKEVED